MAGTGYEPHFDIDFRRGLIGETLVGSFLADLAGKTVEVKTDFKAWSTGNVYVETYQKTRTGLWVPSGINVTLSDYYCFAGPKGVGFITIRTQLLRELAKDAPRTGIDTESEHTRATKGRLVRVSDIIGAIFEKG